MTDYDWERRALLRDIGLLLLLIDGHAMHAMRQPDPKGVEELRECHSRVREACDCLPQRPTETLADD